MVFTKPPGCEINIHRYFTSELPDIKKIILFSQTSAEKVITCARPFCFVHADQSAQKQKIKKSYHVILYHITMHLIALYPITISSHHMVT